MGRTRSMKFRSKIATTLVALLVVGLMAPTASATIVIPKLFTMTVSPSTSPAGASTQFTATFTNWWLQKLGSADLSVPAAYSITSVLTSRGTATVVGNTVQLRSLNLAFLHSFTVKVTATASFTPSVGNVWSAAAKTGADFTGSLFLLLTPTSRRTSAVTAGRTVVCDAGLTCTGSLSQGDTSATVTAFGNGATAGVLTMSFTPDGIDCTESESDYTEHSSMLSYDVTGGPRETEVTLSLETHNPEPNLNDYKVCFQSNSEPPVLLPFCYSIEYESNLPPCVEEGSPSSVGSVVSLTFLVPAGDPKGRV